MKKVYRTVRKIFALLFYVALKRFLSDIFKKLLPFHGIKKPQKLGNA